MGDVSLWLFFGAGLCFVWNVPKDNIAVVGDCGGWVDGGTCELCCQILYVLTARCIRGQRSVSA